MFTSTVKSNEGKYPLWNETASFMVEDENNLHVQVFHQQEIVLINNIQIGKAEICLQSIFQSGRADDQFYDLIYCNTVAGKIELTIIFESSINKNFGTSFNQSSNIGQFGNSNQNVGNSNQNNNFGNNSQGNSSKNVNQNSNFNNNQQNNSNQNVGNFNQNTGYPNQNTGFGNNSNQGNSGYSGGNSLFTSGIQFTGISNNSQNQINTTDYQKSHWHKTLSYFKNTIFFKHNSSEAYYYDNSQHTWSTISNLSNNFFPQYHRITELPDGSYLITGGEVDGVTISNVQHFIEGNFIEKFEMYVPRKAHGQAYLKGHVYVFGGYTDNGKILYNCEKYDMNNGNWMEIAKLNHPRGYATTCVFGESHIFIVGGVGANQVDGVYIF